MTSNGAQQYSIATIRRLLLAAFTAEELRRFCYDRPTFRPVVSRFGPGQGLDDMVDELITYCDTRLLVSELLAEVRQHNPRQYARFMEPGFPIAGPTTPGGGRRQEGPGMSQGWLGKPTNMALVVGIVVAVLAIGACLLVLAIRPGIGPEEEATDTPVPPTVTLTRPMPADTPIPPMPTDTSPPPAPTNTPIPPAPTDTSPPPAPTDTPTPSTTPTPTVTPTPSVSPTPTPPTPRAGDTWTRPKDGAVMVGVPSGGFLMGSTKGDPDAYDQEIPQHTVYVDAFWIDKYEVTNAQYRRCVDAGHCREPGCWDDGDLNSPVQPVVCVTWDDARGYAAWVGGRLPTEAEWEKAARGENGLLYPWGNSPPNCDKANHRDCVGKPLPVGTHPDGASPYGALDMAGNVTEWTQSLYWPYPYRAGDGREDLETYDSRVVRGGSSGLLPASARCAFRRPSSPGANYNHAGFRVVVAPGTSGP